MVSRSSVSKLLMFFILPLLETTQQPILTDDVGDASEYNPDKGIYLLLDAIAVRYTPNCLKVLFMPKRLSQMGIPLKNAPQDKNPRAHQYKTFQASNGIYDDGNVFMLNQEHVIVNEDSISRTTEAIGYINKHAEKVTSTACVIYMLSGPPDSRLLPVLTDPTSSKRLTRYFLVHTQNSTEAKQLLLDERMLDEENVAALVIEESEGTSYWRVLIRQLLHPSGSPQVLTVNRWSRDTGLASTENIFPEQMANFYGQRLTAVSLFFKPFAAYEKIEGSLIVKPKPSIDVYLLNLIAYKLNFTYDLVMPPDGLWSGKKDGHYQGVMGEVEARQANFSLVLSMTVERSLAVDFTRLYFKDPLTFITAKSAPSPPWRKIITPFRAMVWLCVLVSVGGGSLLYHIIYHAQATLTSSRLLSSHAFMHVLASFLSQSLGRIPWLHSGRVFFGAWLLYAFLITSYYKTSLTSTLAVPFALPSINTLDELLRSSLSFGVNEQKGSPYRLFYSSNIPLYQDMFRSMSFYSLTESRRRVAEGSYAFIGFKSYLTLEMVLHNSNPNRDTDLHVATEEFFPGGYAWAFPKGSPYRRPFDSVMRGSMQFGLINKWLADLYPIYLKEIREQNSKQQEDLEEDQPEQDDRVVVLNLNHLQGPFSILILGIASGGLLLVAEILLSYWSLICCFPIGR